MVNQYANTTVGEYGAFFDEVRVNPDTYTDTYIYMYLYIYIYINTCIYIYIYYIYIQHHRRRVQRILR